MKSNKKIAVLYLMWLPYGYEQFHAFFRSYVDHPAGVEADLYILFKDGNGDSKQLEPYHQLLSDLNITYQPLSLQGGLDIDAYFFAAKKIETEYVFFLNTASIIQCNDWLKKYSEVMEKDKTALISATASNQSHYTSVYLTHPWYWEKGKGFVTNFRKYKLFIKAFFYWRFLFKSFPNPHIRTNAFMVNRLIFLEMDPGPVNTKFNAFLFESGSKSLTNQFIKKGYNTLIIDKEGKTYRPGEWKFTKIFWNYNQEDLVVSDNQTRLYDRSSAEEKKIMRKKAWGTNE